MVNASEDQRVRQAQSELRRPGVIAARAWVKSPSAARCWGAIVSISSPRRRRVSSLTPVGAGAPARGRSRPCRDGDPRRTGSWRPAPKRRVRARVSRILRVPPQTRSRIRRLFKLRHHPVDTRRQGLVRQPLAQAVDHQWEAERRWAFKPRTSSWRADIVRSVSCSRRTSSSSSSTSRSACLRSPLGGSYLRNTS